jgi:hypothetical protein
MIDRPVQPGGQLKKGIFARRTDLITKYARSRGADFVISRFYSFRASCSPNVQESIVGRVQTYTQRDFMSPRFAVAPGAKLRSTQLRTHTQSSVRKPSSWGFGVLTSSSFWKRAIKCSTTVTLNGMIVTNPRPSRVPPKIRNRKIREHRHRKYTRITKGMTNTPVTVLPCSAASFGYLFF